MENMRRARLVCSRCGEPMGADAWDVGYNHACGGTIVSAESVEDLRRQLKGAIEAERQRIAALVRDKAEGTWDSTVETVLRALVREITNPREQ